MKEDFNGISCIDVEKVGVSEGAGGATSEGKSSATHNTTCNIDSKVFKSIGPIPEQYKVPGYRFVLLLPWQKIPAERGYTKTELTEQDWEFHNATGDLSTMPRLTNYSYDDQYFLQKLKEGYNYAILCNSSGPKIFDSDDVERLKEIGNFQRIPKTFTIETQSGNQHKVFNIPEMKGKIIFYDPTKVHEVKTKKGKINIVADHLGEVQSGNVLAVGPGSIYREIDESKLSKDKNGKLNPPNIYDKNYKKCFKGPERIYRVIDDTPITTIALEQLHEILKGLKLSERPNVNANKVEYDSDRSKFAEQIGLKIEDLIDIGEFRFIGENQIQGCHPAHGSTRGSNFVADLEKQIWCCFRHMGETTSGGDAIALAAVIYEIIDCEQAVKGFWSTEEGRKAYAKTLETLRGEGYEIPEINRITPTEWRMGYYVNLEGKTMNGHQEKDEKTATWISDGWAYVDHILENYSTSGSIERFLVIKGKPLHKDFFSLKIKAAEASEKRRLKAALDNEFGVDVLGKLDLDVIKQLSNKAIQYIKLFNRPQWCGEKLVAPGLNDDDVRFDFEKKVAVDFRTDGIVEEGVQAIRCFLQAFEAKNSVLLFATFFGAPAISKLWPDERFALFLIGTTGTLKTSAAMLLNSIYGKGYNLESNLVRWGDGATSNATEHLAARTGPFPFLEDNFKLYTDQDAGRMQRMIHAILEGTEKDRMTKSSNSLRSTEEYSCIPIITGENYPGQDAATRARIVQIDWTGLLDKDKMTEAQKHVSDLNALGKAWCLWLSSPEGRAALDTIASKFDETRSYYIKQAGDAVNVGRLATNAAILSLIWELLNGWSVMNEVTNDNRSSMESAIKDHIIHAQDEISENLDAEKFINWLKSDILVGKCRLLGLEDSELTTQNSSFPEDIGVFRKDEDGKKSLLILPEIFDAKLIPAWQKQMNGTKTDRKALLRQLIVQSYVIKPKKGNTHNRNYNGNQAKVIVFDWSKIFPKIEKIKGESKEI